MSKWAVVWLFLAEQQITENTKIQIYDISADILYICIILPECGYQMLVTKMCNGGWISYILKSFISDISALNSKYFTYQFVK